MQQLSIDDYYHIQDIESLPGRVAFIDECGSFGFNYTEIEQTDGSADFYIVCAVIVKNCDLEKVNTQVEKIAHENFEGSEMKSSSIGDNIKRRKKLLFELAFLDFSLIVLVVDKKRFIKDSPLSKYRDSFVKFLHEKLYELLYSTYPKLKIVEDEYGSDEFQSEFRKYVQSHRPEPNLLNEYDFDYINSHDCRLVQVADIIAGSINKQLINSDSPDVLSFYKSKIYGTVMFPNQGRVHGRLNGCDNEFNKEIYDLACLLVSQYIELNKKNETDIIRMRLSTIKYLLFEANYVNSARYVTSSSLIKHLNSQFDTKITKEILFRNIIAPLRDDKVILASCPHGYKIPSSVDDLNRYLSQTSGIVNPMLHRVGLCRSLIINGTTENIDILNSSEYSALKRYFGD